MGDQRLQVDTLSRVYKEEDKRFEEITFKHLLREENYLADALATLATMFKVNANVEAQLVKLEVRESYTHYDCI